MKRVGIQFCTFLVLLFLLTIVRFPYHDFGVGLFDDLRAELRTHGILLDAEEIDFDFPINVRLSKLSLLLPGGKIPIPLFFDHAELDPKLLALLLLRGELEGSMKAYAGEVSSEVRYALWGKSAEFTLDAKSLQLSQHPLLAANGIAGRVSVQAAGLLVPGVAESSRLNQKDNPIEQNVYRLDSGTTSVQLDEGGYQGGYKIQGLIPIPQLKDVRGQLRFSHKNGTADITTLELFSSLGELNAHGSIQTTPEMSVSRMDIKASLALTADGAQAVGAYLALAAGLPVDNPARNWELTISQGSPGALPTLDARPK
jgi:type II secretion system protein N